VEQGIDAALIPHAAAGRDSEWVASIIGDQLDVAEGLFAFVKQDRELSAGYIKELHQALTRNQETTTSRTSEGRLVDVPLQRGAFKQQPNNPIRPDGSVHEYAPPEQVASEMDRLVEMHLAHRALGVAHEVEAAWLHHRFTQIHPFQDGNGRVARALATLVFPRAGWLPPVIRDEEDRTEYIAALDEADRGDLQPLVTLFARAEKTALMGAIGLSTQVIDEQRDMGQLIAALSGRQSLARSD
jgi:Fic family protein